MPSTRPRLLLATGSADKIRELRELLTDLPIELLQPGDVGLALEVEETGQSFDENAELKVRAWHQATGLVCLAEDSGFEVDALGGEPGVQSARWEGSDYERKNQLVIELVGDRVGIQRRCRYVCSAALLGPDGRLHRARGTLTGRVATRPAGTGGFGYDPIFLLPGPRRTLAEVSTEVKNGLSHRARAVRRLRPIIERELLGE